MFGREHLIVEVKISVAHLSCGWSETIGNISRFMFGSGLSCCGRDSGVCVATACGCSLDERAS